jgi:hypothetical protein
MAVTKLSSREFNRADVFKSDSGSGYGGGTALCGASRAQSTFRRDALIAALVHNHDGATRIREERYKKT